MNPIPIIRHIPNDDEVELLKAFKIKLPNFGIELSIKHGFCYAGSFPEILEFALGDKTDDPTTSVGYLVHDILYATRLFNRYNNDCALLYTLKRYGCGWLRRNAIFMAVRSMGKFAAYNNHTIASIKDNRMFISTRFISDKHVHIQTLEDASNEYQSLRY